MNKKKSSVAIVSILLVIIIGIGVYVTCTMSDVWDWANVDQDKNNFEDVQNGALLVNQASNGQITQLSFSASTSDAKLTVADLKNQFLAAGVDDSNKYAFKPFYNVEQNTQFTFHFNSKVDPIKAITVHTDEKCDYMSLVWQINDAYWTEDGIDVIVKPSSTATLYTKGRTGEEKNVWGYAPVYYICIRYDLNSKEVKKLDKPIIIPFTIKNEISTPTVYAFVNEKGTFSVKWNKVEGAVAYKIYGSGKNVSTLSPSESGYRGTLSLLTTLDASKLEYNPGLLLEKSQLLGTGYEDNTVRELFDKYNIEGIREQNANLYNHKKAIYVTAVDANGNESNFGFPVDLSNYSKTLPRSLKSYLGTINEFPETIEVKSVDSETVTSYPINFYKLSEPASYSSYCDYRYEVVGTMLTGVVSYENKDRIFPDEKISNYKLNTSGLPQGTMEQIPQVTVATFADREYSNSKVDLKKTINYPADAKVKLDSALLMRLADNDLARRVIRADVNATDPREEWDSFIQSNDPDYILVREGTKITVQKVDKNNKNNEPTQVPTTEKELEQFPTTEKEIDKKTEEDKTPAKEIDNSNYVEEQQKSTEKQVKEGDAEEVKGTKYPVFADNAAQLYLALALINQEPVISLKAFPEYQIANNLIDDMYYIWFQNPYIMGFNINKCTYTNGGLELIVDYNVPTETAKKYQEAVYEKSQKVANQIIKPNMSNYEKVVAIYDYLENNAEYNNEAVKAANENLALAYKKYANCWNTYGILCEELGVCQSYSYAFNSIAYFSGLETIMVTGTMNGVGHAWNAVKLDGNWYMVDTTNNGNCGIPYWVCNSSTDYIESASFSLDSDFVDGTDFSEYLVNNNTQDWYYKNNLMAESINDLAKIWEKHYKQTDIIWAKYMGNDSLAEPSNRQKFVNQVQSDGYDIANLEEWTIYCFNGGIVALKKK